MYVGGKITQNLKINYYYCYGFDSIFLEFYRGTWNFQCNDNMFVNQKEHLKAKAMYWLITDAEYTKAKGANRIRDPRSLSCKR